MSKIVSIEGNIGSGKSTLIKKLKEIIKNDDILFLDEPVDEWMEIKDHNGEHILSKFYENQERYSFTFQMMAYISRLNKLKEALKTKKKIIFTERSLETDKHVFAQMLYDSKKIDIYEYQIYNKWFDSFNEETKITEIIYIKTDTSNCFKRIDERSRSGEKGIKYDYLNDCDKYHDNMIKVQELKNVPILTLDGNKNVYDNETLREWIMLINNFITNNNLNNCILEC